MPRIRSIKHDLYLDEELATLPYVCRYAFPGLWTLADREGRLEDRPARIKAQLFPYELEVDMDDILARLDRGGFVHRYEVGGVRYLQIRAFGKHQQVNARESRSKIPPPPGHAVPTATAGDDVSTSDDDTDTSMDAHRPARARTDMNVHARGERYSGNGIQGRDLPPTPQGASVGGPGPVPVVVSARLVPRPPGTRVHPLDEDHAAASSDVQQRAAAWLERFAEAHLERRGSRFLVKPQRDFDPAVRLARAYTDTELGALTVLFLDATGDNFDDKPRTPGRLELFAPMLEERLKEVGQWPSAA